MTASPELYDLFLTLAPLRLDAGRDALDADEDSRGARLSECLLPFAVDATLLGADGLSLLAQAIVKNPARERRELDDAIAALVAAVGELASGGDESGARVDESALIERARALDARGSRAASRAPRGAAPSGAGQVWAPTLGDEMVAAFIDECGERLEGLSDKLLTLEANQDDPELVAAIFRDLHTVKGSSAFAGLLPMNRISHAAEDLIAEIRSGKRAVDRRLVDTLLAALDVLRAILAKANAGEAIDVDEREILARLEDPSADVPVAAPASAGAPAASPPVGAASGPMQPAAAPAATATLRIGFEKVDLLLNLIGELVLSKGRLLTASERQMSIPTELSHLRRRLHQALDHGETSRQRIDALLDDVQRAERALAELCGEVDAGLVTLSASLGLMRDQVMKLRMVPISRLFSKYQRTLRELSAKLGKEVRLEVSGGDTELDKILVEQLDDPLLHIVRNAVDHGIEPPSERVLRGKPSVGHLSISASQIGGSIVVIVADDGAGLDVDRLKAKAIERGLITEAQAATMPEEEALELVFRPGLSTAKEISDVSGRGVGMDVVREAIVRLKGTISMSSRRGEGTRLELRLPLTLAIAPVVAARVGGELVAIPLDAVVAAQRVAPHEIELVAGAGSYRHEGQLLAAIDLAAVLGVEAGSDVGGAADAGFFAVVVDVGGERFALLLDELAGRHEVVVKPLGPLFAAAPFVAGACLIDDRVVLLLDLVAVTEGAATTRAATARATSSRASSGEAAPGPMGEGIKVLIADDSDVVLQSLRRALEARGFEVVAARDGREALDLARREHFAAVTSDVTMPEMDGFELVRELRKLPQYERTPIVLLTAREGRVDELRGVDAGADVYLRKPVDPQTLAERLIALLARGRESV